MQPVTVPLPVPAAGTSEVQAASDAYLFGNYRRAPLAFSHGQGARLWDLEGREYLDFVAGIAVSSLGHAHPGLTRALAEQLARYVHVSNLFLIPEQAAAARLLVEASGLDRAFFCNSGAEAVEAAIKLARRRAADERGAGVHEIVVAEGSFHGRTLGALAATGNPAYHAGFGPLPAGFRFVPFNDLAAAEAAINPATCAVLIEPIQGEGGIIPADGAYLAGLQELCRAQDALFMLDEVQTGIGRTGRLFAFEHFDLAPDVVCLAKGLGGGVPVGAVLAREAVAAHLVPGSHGSTFGGNALAATAACAVLTAIRDEELLPHVTEMGRRLTAGLRALARYADGLVVDVRGPGLLVGVDLAIDAAPLVAECAERGLLVNAVRPRTLRLAPPLVVTADEIDAALAILAEALAAAVPPPEPA
jgi:predicted acetylornithine/succinylornithine family transaminase